MKGGSSATAPRSESEKEKTKMRERQRRAITGKIFHGLRKHGGYRLSPRADINEVLRHLAAEAGWSVHSDGTTFRSSVGNCCPSCGATRSSATPTPTSSSAAAGGECSTTASPLHYDGLSAPISGGGNFASRDLVVEGDIPMALYGFGGVFGAGIQQFQSPAGFLGGGGASQLGFKQQLLEARASNPGTPSGSPLRRGNYGSQ